MGLTDILQQYMTRPAGIDPGAADAHFDEVARAAPPAVVGQGVADAFRADSTPPFGQMVAQMFGQSDPQQRAGVLNQLLRSVAPGVLSAIGGGVLGHLAGTTSGPGASSEAGVASGATGVPPQITPQQASQMTPAQVQEIANHAEQHDPSVLDSVGGFYAQHPQLVKTSEARPWR